MVVVWFMQYMQDGLMAEARAREIWIEFSVLAQTPWDLGQVT